VILDNWKIRGDQALLLRAGTESHLWRSGDSERQFFNLADLNDAILELVHK
jgi:hypothetical protein